MSAYFDLYLWVYLYLYLWVMGCLATLLARNRLANLLLLLDGMAAALQGVLALLCACAAHWHRLLLLLLLPALPALAYPLLPLVLLVVLQPAFADPEQAMT
jgi:hypothetical protein